jgi:(p)ppGpp synthase/HD superfamily hydrolase
MGINITHLETQAMSTEDAWVVFSVSIIHIDQVNALLKNLQKIKGVQEVQRL